MSPLAKRAHLSLILTLWAGLASCGDPAPSAPGVQSGTCVISSDCAEGELCVAGVCEAPAEGGEEAGELCSEQWDCPMDERCDLSEWRCVPRDCLIDQECELGSICALGACTPNDNADHDRDSVPDAQDNCPENPNTDQGDLDADGLGDACDDDIDGDGLLNDPAEGEPKDLCPALWSQNNNDTDEDGVGDVCDDDIDDDELQNLEDNCPLHPNPLQTDSNQNGVGDACDYDSDSDGTPDFSDNCVEVFNPGQYDLDRDTEGDECDSDVDGDGVPNDQDNCRSTPNPNQVDSDGDSVGDACANDIDGDEVLNENDNCPEVFNPEQRDQDVDGLGDVCDTDLDGDQALNDADNCPLKFNLNQADVDEDGVGDACDYDADNDGVINTVDNCPSISNPEQLDENLNEIGDACDPDLDSDGVTIDLDNCPSVYNPLQADLDGDATGDACDADIDEDGHPNEEDNCPTVVNANQGDMDADGIGDLCDADRDGDAHPNELDNCPNVPNPNQARTSGLEVGDACAGDRDHDLIFDDLDNCPDDFNPDQLDTDGDLIGDICDLDQDGDGLSDDEDNCPFTANPEQTVSMGDESRGEACEGDLDNDGVPDSEEQPGCESIPNDPALIVDLDQDGIPDECDDDLDNDGTVNELDSCPFAQDTLNDLDGDGVDNACDVDVDGDLIPNFNDNCPQINNPDQRDVNQNQIGDACEADDDLDGVPNGQDLCPGLPIDDLGDLDNDGVGDACDPDLDNDGLGNDEPVGGQKNEDMVTFEDNCIGIYNPGQEDEDRDGIGDACDSDDPSLLDRDSDGSPDLTDNCPYIYNRDQADLDNDGVGDHCDADLDNDGFDEFNATGDRVDNCPRVPNPDQLDDNGDQVGDLCEADRDMDQVLDREDNCPSTYNPAQRDSDQDGLGDLCDADLDNDGVPNLRDNCVLVFNPNQEDINLNRIGDTCEVDTDQDGIYDFEDLCPNTPSQFNGDLDQDGVGNPCDPDIDGDGVDNDVDNCVFAYNVLQANQDGDEYGDACAHDFDGDGVPNLADNCPYTYNPLPPSSLNNGQWDSDGDGLGDACDFDRDGDGVNDPEDNCPDVSNPNQENQNDGQDDEGDACDSDRDGDGVPNEEDNCPDTANADQEPHPFIRTVGVACIDDTDNDRQPDFFDNCPLISNEDQRDQDGDGIGDACDSDADNDGVSDNNDNCPYTANADQTRSNPAQPYGDACLNDVDGDGVPNELDGCPDLPNGQLNFTPGFSESDFDGDGIFDFCDPDQDGDGVVEYNEAGVKVDNCPFTPNPNQRNRDDDTLGDACDQDMDNDGRFNYEDNCVQVSNPYQEDTNLNGIGDACEVDDDLDGIPNHLDLCPDLYDVYNSDIDFDLIGDACDDDRDGDGFLNSEDLCPSTPTLANIDSPECQADRDGDGIPNEEDNCPLVFNPVYAGQQPNIDEDGLGDVCDEDMDNDGYLNEDDNCPRVSNPEQVDTDGNGTGDACGPRFSDLGGGGVEVPSGGDNAPRGGTTSVEAGVGAPAGGTATDGGVEAGVGAPAGGTATDGGVEAGVGAPTGGTAGTDTGTGGIFAEDADLDGVPDVVDNCPALYNPAQEDFNKDGVGFRCPPSYPEHLISSDQTLYLTATQLNAPHGSIITTCNEVLSNGIELMLIPPIDTPIQVTVDSNFEDLSASLKLLDSSRTVLADTCSGNPNTLYYEPPSQNQGGPYILAVVIEQDPANQENGVYIDVHFRNERFKFSSTYAGERFVHLADVNGDGTSELISLTDVGDEWQILEGGQSNANGFVSASDPQLVHFKEYGDEQPGLVVLDTADELYVYQTKADLSWSTASVGLSVTGSLEELEMISNISSPTQLDQMVMARVDTGTNQNIDMFSFSDDESGPSLNLMRSISSSDYQGLANMQTAQLGFFEGSDPTNHSPNLLAITRDGDGNAHVKHVSLADQPATVTELTPLTATLNDLAPTNSSYKLRALNHWQHQGQTSALLIVNFPAADSKSRLLEITYDPTSSQYQLIELGPTLPFPLDDLAIGDVNSDGLIDLIPISNICVGVEQTNCSLYGHVQYKINPFLYKPAQSQLNLITRYAEPTVISKPTHISQEGLLVAESVNTFGVFNVRSYEAHAHYQVSAPLISPEVALTEGDTLDQQDAELYDIDDDGRLDSLYFLKGSSDTKVSAHVRLGLRDGLFGDVANQVLSFTDDLQSGYNGMIAVGDQNGDGLADLAYVNSNAVNSHFDLYLAYGLHDQLTRVSWPSALPVADVPATGTELLYLKMLDLNDDSVDDVLMITYNGTDTQVYRLLGNPSSPTFEQLTLIGDISGRAETINVSPHIAPFSGVRLYTNLGTYSITASPTFNLLSGVPGCTNGTAYPFLETNPERTLCVNEQVGDGVLHQWIDSVGTQQELLSDFHVTQAFITPWSGHQKQVVLVGDAVSVHQLDEPIQSGYVPLSVPILDAALSDLNHDGALDLVMVNEEGSTVHIFNENAFDLRRGVRAQEQSTGVADCSAGSFNVSSNPPGLDGVYQASVQLSTECRISSLQVDVQAQFEVQDQGAFLLWHVHDGVQTNAIRISRDEIDRANGKLTYVNTPQLALFEGEFASGEWRLMYEPQACAPDYGDNCPTPTTQFSVSDQPLDAHLTGDSSPVDCDSQELAEGCLIKANRFNETFLMSFSPGQELSVLVEVPAPSTQDQPTQLIVNGYTTFGGEPMWLEMELSPYRYEETILMTEYVQFIPDAETSISSLTYAEPRSSAHLVRLTLSTPITNQTPTDHSLTFSVPNASGF